MRKAPFLFLGLTLALLASPALTLTMPAMAQDADEALPPTGKLQVAAVADVMQKAVDGFIRPGYRDLVESTQSMAEAMNLLCATPSEKAVEDVQVTFDDVVQKWAQIEIVRVGPVIEGNRFERFLFFPDRKSTGLKQVQRIIAESDETATSADRLKGKSVAAQGLGAIEYVLYGTGADVLKTEKNGFRCRYGAAIAGNLQSVATELQDAWDKPDGIQQAWKHPGPDNPVYRNENEVTTELLGILVHGVESIRDQRLRPFYAGIIKGTPDKGHPRLAIYWRSGNTMPAIATNFTALQTLFDTADMKALLPPEKSAIADDIDVVFGRVIGNASAVDLPVDEAIADETQRAQLNLLLRNTNDLLQRLNLDFGAAIGLGAGFSFADGD